MNNKYVKILVIILGFFITGNIFAQGPPPPPPPIFPIDGGIFALFAAGVIYAVKKIKDKNR